MAMINRDFAPPIDDYFAPQPNREPEPPQHPPPPQLQPQEPPQMECYACLSCRVFLLVIMAIAAAQSSVLLTLNPASRPAKIAHKLAKELDDLNAGVLSRA